MRYIKSITQQKLSFLLAIYIGLFMNGAVFYRRFGSYAHDFTVWKGVSDVVELAATVLVDNRKICYNENNDETMK